MTNTVKFRYKVEASVVREKYDHQFRYSCVQGLWSVKSDWKTFVKTQGKCDAIQARLRNY